MELQTLAAKTRQAGGKGIAHRTRAEGVVPAVLYGGGSAPVSLKLNEREFDRVLHGRGGQHAIVQLQFDDQPELNCPALVKAVQHHPVRGEVLHADFMRIRLDQRITTLVPIVLTGQAKGVVDGGIIDHQLREIEVECLALEVPEKILVDITELGIGHGVHVGQVAAPSNVTIVTDRDRPVVAVHAPRVVKAAEVPEEIAVAEGEAAAEEGAEGEAGAKEKDKDKEKEKGEK